MSDTNQPLVRAQAAIQAKRYGEGIGICNDVLGGQPDCAPALALLSVATAHTGDTQRAIDLMERAVVLHGNDPSWHSNLGLLHRLMYNRQHAVNDCTTAVRMAPDHPDYLVNLSLAFTDLGQHDRAMACLLRALKFAPDHADAHLALAQNLLMRGEFLPGWVEYEWRNLTEAGKNDQVQVASARWNGMRIPTGRILLIGDQGYGDTIQFSRYIPMVAERCSEVILGCSLEILPLFRDFPGVEHAQSQWDNIPGHATYCRLSSLPGIFDTTLETIPAVVPVVADTGAVDVWARRLDALPAGTFRIGLAWAGRSTHSNDRHRSMRLVELSKLGAVSGCSFVSLQKPIPAADTEAVGLFPGMEDLSPGLTDFAETAALIANLDLVITVDTAVAHLAGAMGKPTWIMLPTDNDWRWMIEHADTPWYPTVRLFRQAVPGDWSGVVEAVVEALVEAK